MEICGVGTISSVGRGLESFAKALQQGPMAPKLSVCSPITKKRILVFSVDDVLLSDKDALRKSRRADRFCKMAVLAAWDALADSGIKVMENEKIGVIVATGFGPHKTTFNFLDNILDYGENGVSPTIFSHSVHNAAASYITSALNIKGPVSTLTDFCFPFHNALIIAKSWLNQKRCKYVLVGMVDEISQVMRYICSQKLRLASDGKVKPLDFSRNPVAVPGEGSTFFLLGDGKGYCKVSDVTLNDKIKEANLYIIDADGMCGDEAPYKELASNATSVAPLVGSMIGISAFSCVAAAIKLKNNLDLDRVSCIRYNCGREKAVIGLEKS